MTIEEEVDKKLKQLDDNAETRKQPSKGVRRVRIKRARRPPEREMLEQMPDIVEEQLDGEGLTTHCPEAETDMEKVRSNPAFYLEINMVKQSRVVDTFYIHSYDKKFTYQGSKFKVVEEGVYLLPRGNFFVPTSFYHEEKGNPVGFRQTNKGITGKALTLLYQHRLYKQLIFEEGGIINALIVILSIAILILYAVGLYFLTGGTAGGVLPA